MKQRISYIIALIALSCDLAIHSMESIPWDVKLQILQDTELTETPYQNAMTLSGHTAAVRSAHFNYDSTKIITASYDDTARIWDSNTGACLQILNGHTKLVNSAHFNHDSTKAITASYDKTARIWDSNTGACLQILNGHTDSVNSAHFNHDSTKAITASSDDSARIWDSKSGTSLQTVRGYTNWSHSAHFNHDSTKVISASYDNTARIWDSNTGTSLQILSGHVYLINSAHFNHDGTKVITASGDKTARIWDSNTGACLQILSGHTDLINSAHFNHDSTKAITASGDRSARIWDSKSGACLQILRGNTSWINSAHFNHDSTKAITASDDCTACIWEQIPFDNMHTLIRKQIPTSLMNYLFMVQRIMHHASNNNQNTIAFSPQECLYLRFIPKKFKHWAFDQNNNALTANILKANIKLLHSSPIQKKEGSEYSGLMYDDIEENVPTILEEYAHLVKDIKRTRLEKKQYTLSAKSLATIKKLPKELYETILSGLKAPLEKESFDELKKQLRNIDSKPLFKRLLNMFEKRVE